MSSSTDRSRAAGPEQADRSAVSTGSYVYGIVPVDVELDDARGVGEPPGRVKLIRHGEIAALVSDVATNRPLGKPQDLMAHQRLLDSAAAEVPVLPLRFGAVMTDDESVVDELLTPHHDAFLAGLKELEGRAEYVIKGRYAERAILAEVLGENAEAARLRQEIAGKPEDATWDARIRLGEVINQSVEAKRDADTRAMVEALAPLCVAIAVREATHEQDAVHLAALVETDRQDELEQALDEFARRWEGRVDLRLIGPLAAYDFVMTPQQEQEGE
ncbi:GvpL/GvpF family gas vesicle protein [Streptosporangium sp. 'caverna']|uniref:GvpL/GvpF family gas vesicle protein n=1 Tax=Streptosporangium sp. 'caverna' TaxID=2202249 RepID=UPI000D7DC62E|nr:GvpL/GvpF family gas vesicle protein [Streptosporangium sp. 'caverna']AWS40640.1 gas vesicle protein GvpFL [Streptosporangium sp. 'caverna']